MGNRILRLPEVESKTGLSRSTIYLHIKEDQFPKPLSLSSRAVGWLDSEIEDWLAEKLQNRGRE